MANDDSVTDQVERERALIKAARDQESGTDQDGAEISSDLVGRTPDRIGHYTIIREIGRGGMGIVYEAEQQDPRRTVALKVVRGGVYVDEHKLKLFRREAQALARLRHPGIAAIHEAGRTEAGQHFFAMELAQGVPLNRYARNEELSLRRRLSLFARICNAVNYAHQRGVIHRDLKPSNILVDADGIPKILDFGLAKITDSDIAATTIVTEVGKIQGTLAYMSPEQARGDPSEIDLRSDIYSLGVILYELLTERLPYSVHRTMLPEAVRVICEEEPRRPSTMSRTLRGDVETIALKAIEKDPARRYQTAGQLAQDVGRYLGSQPILARRPSAVYQFTKLVSRHKIPFLLIALLFASVTVFGVSMAMLYSDSQENLARAKTAEGQAATEAENARTEAETAKRVSDFLVELFQIADPEEALGNTITAREILDSGAERITRELEDEPVIQAALMHTMGTVYSKLGIFDRARELLEAALETRRRKLGHEHLDVSRTLISLAGVVEQLGQTASAESLRREALQIRQAQLPEDHELIAEGLDEMGMSRYHAADYPAAAEYFRQALAMQRRLYGEEHSKIANSLNNLGLTTAALGDRGAGVTLLREALAMQRNLHGDVHPDLANTLEVLAVKVFDRRDPSESEELIREALAVTRKLFEGDHPAIADKLNDLGYLAAVRGDFEEAESRHREALAMRRKLYAGEHMAVLQSAGQLGVLLRDKGVYGEAEQLLREALSICRSLAPSSGGLPSVLYDLGVLLRVVGKYEEAESLLREALTIWRTRVGDQHLDVALGMNALGILLAETGRDEEAASLHQSALAIRRNALGNEDPIVVDSLVSLGECLTRMERFEESEDKLLSALAVLKHAPGEKPVRTLEVVRGLVALYEAWGKPDKAAEYRAILQESEDQP